MRRRAPVLILALAVVVALSGAACSGGDDDAKGSTTTEAGGATTPAAADPSAPTTTTAPPTAADKKLAASLLEPGDFGPGFKASDEGGVFSPTNVCPAVKVPQNWTASANLGVAAAQTRSLGGELLLQYESDGDAKDFMEAIEKAVEKCSKTSGPVGIALKPLEGVGDEALVARASLGEQGRLTLYFARTGDRVVMLYTVSPDGTDPQPVLERALTQASS